MAAKATFCHWALQPQITPLHDMVMGETISYSRNNPTLFWEVIDIDTVIDTPKEAAVNSHHQTAKIVH